MKNTSAILGIDPGLVRTGWGLVELLIEEQKIKYLAGGIIITSANHQIEQRIEKIYKGINTIVETYSPDETAMEEVFINKNAKTSEKLIMARSTILTCFANRGIKVYNYKPNKVKKSVTGNGHASKQTVQLMVESILNQSIRFDKIDTMDALAVAICHCFHKKLGCFC